MVKDAPIIPVISLDSSPLSSSLKDYLKKIEEETGRFVLFSDLKEFAKVDDAIDILTEARVLTSPENPVIWILLKMTEMNIKNYSPRKHDPIIAHEATHASLLSRGFLNLSIYDGISLKEKKAIEAVNNWLTDPQINKEIQKDGFDVASLRIKEIQESTKALNKMIWKKQPFTFALRLAVSFLLEPNIPHSIKSDFKNAVKTGLGQVSYNKISNVLETINLHGFDTPIKFRNNLYKTAEKLEVILKLKLKSKAQVPSYKKFSRKFQKNWIEDEITSWQKWP